MDHKLNKSSKPIKGKKTERVKCNAVLEKLFGKWKRTTKLIERNYLL